MSLQDIRVHTELREHEWLSTRAAKASESAGRPREEPQDAVRTCYQRDRDRILHSKAFRRLKHKTQVFISPVGDHYRTRLTHTLEVSQIARTIGRALRLNEDLVEAIALGHDLGHPPFGHAGEHALDDAIRSVAQANPGLRIPEGFRHDVQSLRVVDVLEDLNLTEETRAGIGGHSKGRNDLSAHDGVPTSTLEAAVVRISDRIAYLSHDIEDALRSRIIDSIPAPFMELGERSSQRIRTMVEDVIVNSLDQPAILISPPLLALMNDLKEWLFERVYTEYPKVMPDVEKAQDIVRQLFRHFAEPLSEGSVIEAIDYVSGMTDRFAIETYIDLHIPRGFTAL